jgi:hypothetical protein
MTAPLRVLLRPPFMSEAIFPKTFREAAQSVIANLTWILPLVAIERGVEGHYWQAVTLILAWVIDVWVAIKWKAFEGLDQSEGRKRLAFVLIAVGAVILGIGIYLLATQPRQQESANMAPAVPTVESGQLAETTKQLAATRQELQELQERTRAAAPSPQIAPIGEKKFTNKTIRQLRALYEGRTALQAEPFMTDEKGKLIDVEGRVLTIHSGMALLVSLENSGDHIECRFEPSWNPKLSTFRQGENMKVRGTIGQSQNGAQIYLDGCEIRD